MRRRWLLLASVMLLGASPQPAAALTWSARIDKTHVTVGEPVQLTLGLEGSDAESARWSALHVPDGWLVVAHSEAQQVMWQQGALLRRVEATFVLIARVAGTYQLGPFTVERQGQQWHTAPITVYVDTGPVEPPPTLRHPPGGRVTL